MNLKESTEIPFEAAVESWYTKVFFPIVEIIRETNLLARFPQSTEADLYVYVGRHWSELVKRYGPLFTLEEAAEDFSIASRARLAWKARRWKAFLGGLFGKRGKKPGDQPPVV